MAHTDGVGKPRMESSWKDIMEKGVLPNESQSLELNGVHQSSFYFCKKNMPINWIMKKTLVPHGYDLAPKFQKRQHQSYCGEDMCCAMSGAKRKEGQTICLRHSIKTI